MLKRFKIYLLIIYCKAIKEDLKAFLINGINKISLDEKVLCRTSCLGNACINKLKLKNTIKLQKMRIDQFYFKNKICKANSIIPYLNNFNYMPFFFELQIDPFLIKRYKYLIFDSFSDLVDSKFSLPNNENFFTVKGDINIHKLLNAGGSYYKQIEVKNIKRIYLSVFKAFWDKYHCNIYFILCPTALDEREYYKERSILINRAIIELSKELDYIKVIKINDKNVTAQKNDSFPYHFSDKTITYISNKLKKEIELNNE